MVLVNSRFFQLLSIFEVMMLPNSSSLRKYALNLEWSVGIYMWVDGNMGDFVEFLQKIVILAVLGLFRSRECLFLRFQAVFRI